MALRNLVLAHHMEDLKETTHKIHYERFRFDKLREMMGVPREIKVEKHTKEQNEKLFCLFVLIIWSGHILKP